LALRQAKRVFFTTRNNLAGYWVAVGLFLQSQDLAKPRAKS